MSDGCFVPDSETAIFSNDLGTHFLFPDLHLISCMDNILTFLFFWFRGEPDALWSQGMILYWGNINKFCFSSFIIYECYISLL